MDRARDCFLVLGKHPHEFSAISAGLVAYVGEGREERGRGFASLAKVQLTDGRGLVSYAQQAHAGAFARGAIVDVQRFLWRAVNHECRARLAVDAQLLSGSVKHQVGVVVFDRFYFNAHGGFACYYWRGNVLEAVDRRLVGLDDLRAKLDPFADAV